ncbi:hypothetical protein EJ02DRAFT_506511 [Clathrospora elynae]|uniref:N-acetylgalactosaminide beta-1,3-galactosyltransferase n=1 Tax=Clathrospora elynae TaxID=706981 RepID=A0A6A5S731_9PLEO|nr:hypothetical protein EJ02DRAFT_506511 [Clathrospora elynae]
MFRRKDYQNIDLEFVLQSAYGAAVDLRRFLPHHHVIFDSPQGAENDICPRSSIADNVLIVVRTGATEALPKLPVHFETTLRCVSDYVIYSDYKEDVQGHHVYDIFDGISDTLKASVPEFELYVRLRIHGREGLNSTTHLGRGPSGSPENPSWKLDQFKFLPMVEKALRHRPSAKWFVFIEADTYLIWQTLLEYLALFNADKALYIGKHMYNGDVLFAHGGSGFVLSAAAMHKYDEYTIKSWAGDMVLGKALRDVDVQLFWAFPHFQGDPVSSLDHSVTKIERRPWCYAPITYHHMREDGIRKLWAFEQGRQRRGESRLVHRDVFKEYVFPNLAARIDDWDNLSMGTEPSEMNSFEKCQTTCETDTNCLQYSYATGKCSTSSEVRLGNEASTRCEEYSVAASECIRWQGGIHHGRAIQSGWVMKRLLKYIKDMDNLCRGGDKDIWVV